MLSPMPLRARSVLSGEIRPNLHFEALRTEHENKLKAYLQQTLLLMNMQHKREKQSQQKAELSLTYSYTGIALSFMLREL